jgi:hypothetical protein
MAHLNFASPLPYNQMRKWEHEGSKTAFSV